jgi:hypothetical protein
MCARSFCSLIQSKHSPQMVLTASMPVKQQKANNTAALTYAGSPVTLQKRKTCQLGSANQKWHHDSTTGILHAFYTDIQDKGNLNFATCFIYATNTIAMLLIIQHNSSNYFLI